jgi:hypothetical protein
MHRTLTVCLAAASLLALVPAAQAELGGASPLDLVSDAPLPPPPPSPLPPLQTPYILEAAGAIAGLQCTVKDYSIHCVGYVCSNDPSHGSLPVWPSAGLRQIGVGVDTTPGQNVLDWGPYNGVYVSPGNNC